MKIILWGANGRLGKEISNQCKHTKNIIVLGVDKNISDENDFNIVEEIPSINKIADVVIDFSCADSIENIFRYCKETNTPAVIASTAHNNQQIELIKQLSRYVPVFASSNMSIGIYILNKLVQQAAQLLNNWKMDIIETHHITKKDSPSGTALTLFNSICKVNDKLKVDIHSLRGGSIVGTHTVQCYGNNETITLTHNAESKGIFAVGAIEAAQFVINKPPKLYGMDDLLITDQVV